MTQIQELLDKEANLANRRYHIIKQIESLRGDQPPVCWGNDDCSTHILSMCPWRTDCDSDTANAWQEKQLGM